MTAQNARGFGKNNIVQR